MSHSFSRSWKSPEVVAKERWARIMKSRDHLCPDSPFLTRSFSWQKHQKEMDAAKQRFDTQKINATEKDALLLATWASQIGAGADLLVPFRGRKRGSNHSAVLFSETIWCQEWTLNKPEIAPWPTVAELKHEGDDRISTSVSHRRFFPVPRFPAGGTDLSWEDSAFLPQSSLDKISEAPHPSIISSTSLCALEIQIEDLEGMSLLGESLMSALDPLDIYA